MVERVTNLLNRFPGYTGYRDKERRRDEDKRIRESTADSLVQVVDALTSANAALVAKRDFAQVSAVEQLIARTRTLADRIRTTSYGYAGLFSDRPIDEPVLDQLRQFDVALQTRVQAMANSGSASSTTGDGLAATGVAIDQMTTLFNARSNVVETAQPTREKAVLDLLDTAEPPKPSSFASLHRGDTFAVLGDNFQVEATVLLDSGINLARVSDTDGEHAIWFGGGATAQVPSIKLVEQAADAVPPAVTLQGATARVESEKGKQDKAAVSYAYIPGADDKVEFILTLAGKTRYYIGNLVNDLDVEVFGSGDK
ncbi:MAG TPA: hypothetical protein VFQ54_09645 [Thermomicrobiales bacterium]|nr:hypothetical protein [Thermomicrobiales bacterium]